MAKNIGTTQVDQSQGSGLSAPSRLIGARTTVNDTLVALAPTYYNPLSVSDGRTASVDMVRLSLKMSDAEWLIGHADTFSTDIDMESWTGRGGIGSYHAMWRYPIGDSAVMLGVGLRGKGHRIDMRRAVLELNPNKTAHDSRLWTMLDRFHGHVSGVSVARYDLAYDIAEDRNNYRMSKDRRKYQAIIDNAVTEYLGVRNRGGFAKLYSKSDESGLARPLTRIELTCDGSWSVEDIAAHWPQVHGWTIPEDTRDWVRVVGMLLSEKSGRGEEVETYLNLLGRGTRKKVRECLRSNMVELPLDVAEYGIEQAKRWEDRLLV